MAITEKNGVYISTMNKKDISRWLDAHPHPLFERDVDPLIIKIAKQYGWWDKTEDALINEGTYIDTDYYRILDKIPTYANRQKEFDRDKTLKWLNKNEDWKEIIEVLGNDKKNIQKLQDIILYNVEYDIINHKAIQMGIIIRF